MTRQEFVTIRKKLGKTQKQIAELLGVSVKAVHSYEQGLRKIPAHVERQIFFLLFNFLKGANTLKACWEVTECPDRLKKKCPAWEFRLETLCWFINGTICRGEAHSKWKEKMEVCRRCEVMSPLMKEIRGRF